MLLKYGPPYPLSFVFWLSVFKGRWDCKHNPSRLGKWGCVYWPWSWRLSGNRYFIIIRINSNPTKAESSSSNLQITDMFIWWNPAISALAASGWWVSVRSCRILHPHCQPHSWHGSYVCILRKGKRLKFPKSIFWLIVSFCHQPFHVSISKRAIALCWTNEKNSEI